MKRIAKPGFLIILLYDGNVKGNYGYGNINEHEIIKLMKR
jgi:hypothetical protein